MMESDEQLPQKTVTGTETIVSASKELESDKNVVEMISIPTEQRDTCDSTNNHVEENLNESPQMSKRMQKRLKKRQQWLEKLPEKRAKEREKLKEKRKLARENNLNLVTRKKLKESTMANSSCKVRVAIDLDFDDIMTQRDLGKCIKQIMHCYTLNRRAANPMQLYFTSFNGKSETEMKKNQGYSNWDVHFESKSYIDVFSKEDIVYLSSESDNLISTLDASKAYIIGGLVDHNAHKGLCYRLAEEKNIAHAQLPISEYLEMKARKVLTIDHVFEILLGVSEGLSWKDAFLKVLPQRKRASLKEEHEKDEIEAGDTGRQEISSAIEDVSAVDNAITSIIDEESSRLKQERT